MPLFVLAAIPVMFRCRYYGMSEIEAVTRASGAQILLAKLVLAGAANLVCMTVLISLAVHLQNSYKELGQIILYCLVPYLVCMVSMLRLLRLREKENMQILMIGNGFDIEHKLPTQYKDFLQFTKEFLNIYASEKRNEEIEK